MSVSFHKFSKAKEIIKKEKDQRFANAGCSFGLSYQEAQRCPPQHNVGPFVVHISLVWLPFCLNLVFKFVILCMRGVKSRAGEPLICRERGEGGSQVLSTSKKLPSQHHHHCLVIEKTEARFCQCQTYSSEPHPFWAFCVTRVALKRFSFFMWGCEI